MEVWFLCWKFPPSQLDVNLIAWHVVGPQSAGLLQWTWQATASRHTVLLESCTLSPIMWWTCVESLTVWSFKVLQLFNQIIEFRFISNSYFGWDTSRAFKLISVNDPVVEGFILPDLTTMTRSRDGFVCFCEIGGCVSWCSQVPQQQRTLWLHVKSVSGLQWVRAAVKNPPAMLSFQLETVSVSMMRYWTCLMSCEMNSHSSELE